MNFENRRTQLDLRLTKAFRFGQDSRLNLNVDVYNLLNSAALLTTTNAYGPQWRYPLDILDGRLIQIGFQMNF